MMKDISERNWTKIVRISLEPECLDGVIEDSEVHDLWIGPG